MDQPVEATSVAAGNPLAASANPAVDLAAKILSGGLSPQAVVMPPAQPVQPPAQFDPTNRYAAPDPNAQPVVPTLPEVPPEQDIRLPENTAENVGHAFAAARAEARRYRQMAEDFRQQVEKVRADYDTYAQRESALAEKLTAEQNRSRELEDKLGKLDLEQAPAFREKYDMPLLNVQDQISATLEQNGHQKQAADEIARRIVMAQSADELQDIPEFAQLPSVAQGMVMYKFSEADRLWADRAHALEEWRATQTGLEQVDIRDSAVASAQHRSELASTGLDRIASVVPAHIWNDPEFAKLREAETEKVKAWFGQASEDQVAAAAMEGALVAPYLYRTVDGLVSEVMRLRGQLEAGTRLRAPTVAPYYVSPPAPPAPPPQAPQPGQGQPWSPADTGDPLKAAESLVANGLRRLF